MSNLPSGVMGMAEQIAAANAPAPVETKKDGWIDFMLPSGRMAKRMANPKGKQMRLASKMAEDDRSLLPLGLVHYTCVVETEESHAARKQDAGKKPDFAKITLDEIDDMPMGDAAKLQSEASDPLAEKKPKTTTKADERKEAEAELEAAVKKLATLGDDPEESSPPNT